MPPTDPQTYFLQQGILGIIIVVLGGVIIWQQRRYDITVKEKDIEVRSLYKAINDLQNLRIIDNQSTIVAAIASNKEISNGLLALKESWKESITRLLEAIQK